MAGGTTTPADADHIGKPRTVQHSRPFFVVPLILIGALSVNLLWEIVRANVGTEAIADWPFRLSLLSMSATATAWTAFVALFMARVQWARSLRPYLGWAIEDEGEKFSPDSDIWFIWLNNAGPGLALVDKVEYRIAFKDQPDFVSDWKSAEDASQSLARHHLADGTDFFIRRHSGPLTTTMRHTEGRCIARFNVASLDALASFDVKISYSDTLGESYEMVLPIYARLPTVTRDAIAKHRGGAPTSP
jgi:hypothetical protein